MNGFVVVQKGLSHERELRARIKIPRAGRHRCGRCHRGRLRVPRPGRSGRHHRPRAELAGLQQRLGHRCRRRPLARRASTRRAGWPSTPTTPTRSAPRSRRRSRTSPPTTSAATTTSSTARTSPPARARSPARTALRWPRRATPCRGGSAPSSRPICRPARAPSSQIRGIMGKADLWVNGTQVSTAGRAPGLGARVRLRHHEPDQAGRQRDRAQALREQPGRDAQPGLQRLDAGRARPEHGPEVPGPPARLQRAGA